MYIDRNALDEYPFAGRFYRKEIADNTLPPSEWAEQDVIVLTTNCDIQESSKSKSGSDGYIAGAYEVYFAFDKEQGVSVRKGDFFRGDVYGVEVYGEVIGVAPTQLGGCMVTVKSMN